MNTSMFLPQTDEQDQYDANGNQIDDINSVVEYIEVALGYDHHPDDEDDDSGQHFVLVKATDSFYEQYSFIIDKKVLFSSDKKKFPDYIESKLLTPSFDILTPPPKA